MHGHFELLPSPRETEMALAHFGRDISHPPRVPLEAVFNSLKAGIGGIWEKQRPESARVIWKSIYYAKMTKIVNLGLDQQFSPNNKVFFLNRYFQKKCCSFSFLRPKFSLGMLFRQFGIFPKSSCQLIAHCKPHTDKEFMVLEMINETLLVVFMYIGLSSSVLYDIPET